MIKNQHIITPKKTLGQNFLQDPNTIRKIVQALDAPSNAKVVEIGPGMGALTAPLLTVYPDLTAIELDQRAVAWLKAEFPSLDVLHQDVLSVDWALFQQASNLRKEERLYLIGNLPYYITSQILFGVLAHGYAVRRVVFMMQLEVAERLVAKPSTKAYGILSVMTQLFGVPKLLFKVSKHVFYPKPDVTSAVVGIDLFEQPPFDVAAIPTEWVRQVVRTAFNQRRKTLRNSLSSIGEVPMPWAELRAEALSPQDFVALAGALKGLR